MRRKLLTLMLCVVGVASAADTYVSGTKVSYRLDKDAITDANTSHLFIDEAGSDSYVEFVCTKGQPVFYLSSSVPLLTQTDYDNDKTPALTYRVDTQSPRSVPTVTVTESDDPDDSSHLSMLAVEDKSDAVLFSAFKNASSKVALRVVRSNGREATFVFPVKGFSTAWAKIGGCK